jgi:glutathione S-transferase
VIRLHDNLSSGNGYKPRLLLAQLGIPLERVEYDIDETETRTPEFLEKVNMNGRVPVLETRMDASSPSRTPSYFTFLRALPSSPMTASDGHRSFSGCFSNNTATSPTSPLCGFG